MIDLEALPKRPSAKALCEQLDELVVAHDESEAHGATLRTQKEELEARIRAADGMCDRIKDYVCNNMLRLGLASVAGDVHKAEAGQAGPKFTFDGKPKDIPDDFAREKRELDKALCKAAWDRGELPRSIKVTRTDYVKFLRA